MIGSKLPPYRVLEEPALAFDPVDAAATLTHPLRGLIQFGPYSQRSHGVFGSMIRIATIGPPGSFRRIADLFAQLNSQQQAQERRAYLPDYPSSAKVLGVQIGPAPAHLRAELPADLSAIAGGEHTGKKLAAAILSILRQFAAEREKFDVVAIHLPSIWEAAFNDDDGFDLHHALKAGAAELGIPTQVLNDGVWSYRCRASTAWRLSIALYSKFGGNPWKIADNPSMQDTAYIGLAYARRGRPEDGNYVTCCSQVFDADGGGMQFVAFDVGDGVDLKNPFLSATQMRMVMARSLTLYQRRNGGRLPRRVVVHKTNTFSADELNGAHDALLGVEFVDCIQVQSSVPWRAVKLEPPGQAPVPNQKFQPAAYPVTRGTLVYLSGRAVLLWTGGNAPDPVQGRNYYQGGNSIPGPLLLTRFAGGGDLETMGFEALALTKMDWNNDALFDPLPVTLKYSQTLARVISHAPALGNQAYPYRLFM